MDIRRLLAWLFIAAILILPASAWITVRAEESIPAEETAAEENESVPAEPAPVPDGGGTQTAAPEAAQEERNEPDETGNPDTAPAAETPAPPPEETPAAETPPAQTEPEETWAPDTATPPAEETEEDGGSPEDETLEQGQPAPEDPDADGGGDKEPEETAEPEETEVPPAAATEPAGETESGTGEKTGEQEPGAEHLDQAYVRIRRETKIYAGPSETKVLGTFTEDAVVFARNETREEHPGRDWLRILFDTEERRTRGAEPVTGYIRAEHVQALPEAESEKTEAELRRDSMSREAAGHLLPVASFRPAEDGAAETTETEHLPEENGTAAGEETAPEPAKAETGARTEADRQAIRRKLNSSYLSGKGTTVSPGMRSYGNDSLPESDHPYGANEDRYWTLVSDGPAAAVSVTFSENTCVEDGYDFITLYNAKDGKIGTYTGRELAGRTVTAAGDRITIRLVSDEVYSEYGFSLTACDFLQEVSLRAPALGTGPRITLRWDAAFCTAGYEIQRAVVNPATGQAGAYRDLGTTAAESFTDKSVSWGMTYSYRVRAYKTLAAGGESFRYYTEYSSAETYIVRTPQIRDGFGSKWYQGVVLNWDAVQGAGKYIIYRAETADGTYARIGETTALTYTDMIPERRNYYYKMRAEATVRGSAYVSLPSGSFMAGYIGRPEGLAARPAGGNAVRLQWNQVEGAAGYVVYRSSSLNAGYQYVTTTAATGVTTYVPRSGTVYYYRIKAFSGAKIYSAFSDTAGVLPMDAPGNIRHVTHTKTSVTLRWDPVPGADYYKVFRSYNGSSWPAFEQTEATTYTFSGLEEVYQYAYFIVKAYRDIPLENGETVSISPGSGTLRVEKNMINFRYFAVFEEDYPGTAEDRLTYGRNEALFRSILSRATPYGRPVAPTGTGTGTNLSKGALISGVRSGLAAQADSNDISLFYINCHGNDSVSTGTYAGQLKLSDGSYMTIGELADLLKEVGGRVIVIIDSCGSGSAILDDEQDYGRQFNQAVVNAFLRADEKIPEPEPEGRSWLDAMLPSHGELRILNKFYVVTACEAGKKGYGSSQGTVLLRRISAALASADTDGDGVIALRELERYLKKTGAEELVTITGTDYMAPQVYPPNSSFEIFRKR